VFFPLQTDKSLIINLRLNSIKEMGQAEKITGELIA